MNNPEGLEGTKLRFKILQTYPRKNDKPEEINSALSMEMGAGKGGHKQARGTTNLSPEKFFQKTNKALR